ncbi:Transposon Tn7 transposition protein TnsC [Brevibacillus laterosporus]|nr:Transposon Tn7 transposition protein TnsC [Brevibacillus laterosporus]
MRSLEKTNNLVLKGDFEEANYKEQDLDEYHNNPFIEALPPIFDKDDVLERFMVTPRITEQDKQSETNIRYHVLKRVKNFTQPLPIHFEVERRLSTLIRRGYLARNPLDKTFLERIRVLHQLREDEEEAHKYIDERLNYIRSTADSLSIIGISGIGKTTAIEGKSIYDSAKILRDKLLIELENGSELYVEFLKTEESLHFD